MDENMEHGRTGTIFKLLTDKKSSFLIEKAKS